MSFQVINVYIIEGLKLDLLTAKKKLKLLKIPKTLEIFSKLLKIYKTSKKILKKF
jgi:hypothetical protein